MFNNDIVKIYLSAVAKQIKDRSQNTRYSGQTTLSITYSRKINFTSSTATITILLWRINNSENIKGSARNHTNSRSSYVLIAM